MEKILSAESKGLPKLVASGQTDSNLNYIIMIRYGDTLQCLVEKMEPFSYKTVI